MGQLHCALFATLIKNFRRVLQVQCEIFVIVKLKPNGYMIIYIFHPLSLPRAYIGCLHTYFAGVIALWEVKRLLNLVVPVSSVTAERSFSALHRLKTLFTRYIVSTETQPLSDIVIA